MKKYRSLAAIIAAVISASAVCPTYIVSADTVTNRYGTPIIFDYDSEDSYQNFLLAHENDPHPEHEVSVKGADATARSSSNIVKASYEGRDDVLYIPGIEDEEYAEWTVNVPEAGLYNVSFDVNLGDDLSNDLTVNVFVNGDKQFNESAENEIPRIWVDTSDIRVDSRDNQIRPLMAQSPVWQTFSVQDPQGYTAENLKFYFNKGKNTVRIMSEGQAYYVGAVNVYQEKELKPYSEIAAENKAKGYKQATESVKFQAEYCYDRSSSTIYPVSDKSSPMTEPSNPRKTRLNTIGGTGWQKNAQMITWKFEVPESGLYNITLKALQNFTSGMFTTRRVYIDGEIPCSELSNIRFPYDTNWYMKTLSDDNGAYEFYLEKGEHTISLDVAFGDITDILREVNNALFTMNECYRKIIVLSGTNPDTDRDYQFDKQIPTLIPDFEEAKATITAQKEKLIALSDGKSGSAVSQLDSMINDLNYMIEKPEYIANRLSTYKNNIAGLSAWVLNMANQPLQLDYIVIKAPEEKEPKATPNFFQSLAYDWGTFIASFTEDYDIISDDFAEDSRQVRVWVNLGRDQIAILKDLVTDSFTPETGINVKLELVQGAIIEATLAGRGPDVALTQASTEPVNFAIRGALVDLSKFEDFDEVVSERFHESAMIPFEFRGGYYAIPEVQNFEMLFYRKDILSELGLGVPQTWQQFKQIVPILRKNNMDIGWSVVSTSGVSANVAASFTIFNTLLYQKGGSYYSDDLKATALGTDAARDAFKEATDYYINYEFPQSYDFATRFRSGDMPLAIQGYTVANLLSVAAPEIKGLWEMAPLPGTLKEDGTIDRTQTSTVNACIMFNNCKDQEAGWEFLKWFTSADVQAEYGIQLERVMGASARYATANREAFKKIPWTRQQQKDLEYQWDYLVGVNEVPGSYYTSRGIQNAFRTTIYDYENAYETLHEWQLQVDEEIARKYEEFGLE